MQCFHISIPLAVRPTLLRQIDMGSLTCAQMCVRVYIRGVRHISYLQFLFDVILIESGLESELSEGRMHSCTASP